MKFPAEYLEEVCSRSHLIHKFESEKQKLLGEYDDPELLYQIRTGKFTG